jgi:hypothetical protein
MVLKTSSRGALKVRVTTKSTLLSGVVIVVLLGLNGSEVVVESVETTLPEYAVLGNPVIRFAQGSGFEFAGAPLGLPPARDQSRSLEHLEVLGHSGQAHGERLGQFGDGSFATGQARQNGTPGRVGQGGEGIAEMIVLHVLPEG